MNQEIKDKLEQAAENYAGEIKIVTEHVKVYNAYFDGAQTILENPVEWGLETTKEALTGRNRILSLQLKNTELQSQLAKYREALEQLKELHSDHELTCILIEEALKQED